MTYTNRQATDSVVERSTPYGAVSEYHDRVRWGPILSGLVIGLSTQLLLSSFGAAIGLSNIAGSDAPRTIAGDVGTGVGIWSVISLFVSLFIAGWVTARACGPTNRKTALLNGAILWGSTLVLSSLLLASGVSGAFGALASNLGEVTRQVQQGTVQVPTTPPGVTAQQAREIANNAATAGWSFFVGSLLGLVAALIGASVGTRVPRTNGYSATSR
jgi:VIT1/CCC1 family predicted Fe2+/Mn2+ transporter